MLILLSPAKKLLVERVAPIHGASTPVFIDKAAELVALMQSKSIEDIAKLMHLSADLATLNYKRYQEFSTQDASCALSLFQGDVYQALQASTWNLATINYSQQHLGILSGLYGFLNPLDLIRPYRLEMGVKLKNLAGNNLYFFWQEAVTQLVNLKLAGQSNPTLINLASIEYFKVIDINRINYPVVTVNFYEKKNNTLKMVGIHAKRARGAMAKFLMQNEIDHLDDLKAFRDFGYQFNPDTSTENHIDFCRAV